MCDDIKICGLQFETLAGLHVNLTVVSFVFKGDSTSDCKFGGAAFYDNQKHFLDLCNGYGSARPARNILQVLHFCYGVLITILRKTQRNLKKSVSLNTFNLIAQVVIVTFSNLMCWIPSNIIYISTSFMSKYQTDLLIWTTKAVTPINSMINPLVFVVSTMKMYCKTLSNQ